MKTVILPLLKTDLSKNNKGRKNNLPTMIGPKSLFYLFFPTPHLIYFFEAQGAFPWAVFVSAFLIDNHRSRRQ